MNELAELRRAVGKLRAEVSALKGRARKKPVQLGKGGGGGTTSRPRVRELPAIPSVGELEVIWMLPAEDDEATGDGQPWWTDYMQTRWYPMVQFTAKSGEVVEEEEE